MSTHLSSSDQAKLVTLGLNHVECISDVSNVLMEECPSAMTTEVLRALDKVLKSFEQYRDLRPGTADPDQFLENGSLARNYLTAQSSVLLVFANTVQALAKQHDLAVLNGTIEWMQRELAQKYEMFFRQPRPYEE